MMKIDSIKFGLATGIVFGVSWIICSLVVMFLPRSTMQMTGHMMHSDFGNMDWAMNGTGILIGFFAWGIIAGVMAWAIAALYNRLTG